MKDDDRTHRRPWLLALLALLLIGVVARYALFRARPAQDELVHVSSGRVFPPVTETPPPASRAPGEAAPVPPADSLRMWRGAPPTAKNTLEDLMGLFEGSAGSDGFAADVAKDPELKSAVDRLRRTSDVGGFLRDPKSAPRLGALLRRHADEPRFAAYIASRPVLASLAARAEDAPIRSSAAAAGPEAHAVRALAGAKAVGDARLTRIDCGVAPRLYQAFLGLDAGKRAQFDPLVRGMLGGEDIHELCRKSGFAETCEEKLTCCQRDGTCQHWAAQRYLGSASAGSLAWTPGAAGTSGSVPVNLGGGLTTGGAGGTGTSGTVPPNRRGAVEGATGAGASATGETSAASKTGATGSTSATGSTGRASPSSGGADSGGDDAGGSTEGSSDCYQSFYGCGEGGVPAYFQKTCCASDGTGCTTSFVAGASPYCHPQAKPPDPCFDCTAWKSVGCYGRSNTIQQRTCPATAPGCLSEQLGNSGMCIMGACPEGTRCMSHP